MIAFLHTNNKHISNFENLVLKYYPNIETKHYVNKNILDTALKTGQTDSVQFEKEIEVIRKSKPTLIICTCSTYGPESDKYHDVIRIDKPKANYLVKNYSRIGLVYTANSTKMASEELLLTNAIEQNKKIDIVHCDCSKLWQYFEDGNMTAYEKGIAAIVKEKTSKVDAFFLAQASMGGAEKYLKDLEKNVYTSPEFGIKEILKSLNN